MLKTGNTIGDLEVLVTTQGYLLFFPKKGIHKREPFEVISRLSLISF
jgi:hypothetical protein